MIGMVVTGGEIPSLTVLQEIKKQCNICIAADSGVEALVEAGITPDLIVGDFDSISDISILHKFSKDIVKMYPEDKDYTDTELAIHAARKKGVNHLILLGGGGGRLDHIFGMYSLFMRKEAPVEWYTCHESVFTVVGSFKRNFKKGKRISIFPLDNVTKVAESSGLKWPIDGKQWTFGDMGISNIIIEEEVSLKMEEGRLLLIMDSGSEDRP